MRPRSWILFFCVHALMGQSREELSALSRAALAEGRVDQALLLLEQAIKSSGSERSLPELYNQMGVALSLRGDYIRAAEFFKEALSRVQQQSGVDHSAQIPYILNLAEVDRKLGRNAETLAAYLEASRLIQKKYGSSHVLYSIVLSNTARHFLSQNSPERALPLLERADRILQNLPGPPQALILTVRSNLCDVHFRLGNTATAQTICQEALASAALFPAQRAALLLTHGQIAHRQGQKDRARENFQQALLLLEHDPLEMIKARFLLGKFYSREEKDRAAKELEQALALMLQHRFRIGRERAWFTHGLAEVFDLYVEVLLQLNRIDQAFLVANHKKGLSFLESANQQEIFRVVGVTDSDRTRWEKLEQEIQRFQAARDESGKEMLWKLDQEREKLYRELLVRYPDLEDRMIPRVSIDKMQESILPGELLAQFHLPANGAGGAFLLTRTNLRWQPLTDPNLLQADLRNFHLVFSAAADDPARLCPCAEVRLPDGSVWWMDLAREDPAVVFKGQQVYLRDPGGDRLLGEKVAVFDDPEVEGRRRDLSLRLQKSLMAPLLKGQKMDHLIVAPDGWLSHAPLALVGDPPLYRTMSLSYTPSAAVTALLRRRGRPPSRLPFFAAGDAIYSGADEGRPDLPFARREVEEILRLAYKNIDRSHSLLGPAARRGEFLRLSDSGLLSRYRFLHLALHGSYEPGKAGSSGLVFSLPGALKKRHPEIVPDAGDRDGILLAGEARSLNLGSDLTVLAACDTVPGLDLAGEGLVALPQSFLLAGSRAVLATLWSLPGEASNDLMRELYPLLFADVPPARALRLAQEKVAKTRKDPYYWASPVLYGQ